LLRIVVVAAAPIIARRCFHHNSSYVRFFDGSIIAVFSGPSMPKEKGKTKLLRTVVLGFEVRMMILSDSCWGEIAVTAGRPVVSPLSALVGGEPAPSCRRHRRHWPLQRTGGEMSDQKASTVCFSRSFAAAPVFLQSLPRSATTGRRLSPPNLDDHHGLVVLLCHGHHGLHGHGPGKAETERRGRLFAVGVGLFRSFLPHQRARPK
jgi:hypothetical protein